MIIYIKTTRLVAICLFGLFIGSCSPYSNKLAINPKEVRFQSILDSVYQANPEAVGIMVHVEAPDQQISWSGAAGLSDKNAKTMLKADQPVWIASITKMYVSTTILRLVEQNKIQLDQSIDVLLSAETNDLLSKDGYNLSEITVTQLLSHTSGVFNYVDADAFFEKVVANPSHRWTRDEQIALAITHADPIGQAGETFSYSDTNYLLLTEIIERVAGNEFYSVIRELIDFENHNLNATWFISLEDEPEGLEPMAHQYHSKMEIDLYDLDPSVDLYGGGGIATNSSNLARFSQLLFEGKIFDDPKTLDLMLTEVETKDLKKSNYYLGVSKTKINDLTAYGHGGFWGTKVQYLPDLNASISIFILEQSKRYLREEILALIVESLVEDEKSSTK